jgi:hypothetical protein
VVVLLADSEVRAHLAVVAPLAVAVVAPLAVVAVATAVVTAATAMATQVHPLMALRRLLPHTTLTCMSTATTARFAFALP